MVGVRRPWCFWFVGAGLLVAAVLPGCGGEAPPAQPQPSPSAVAPPPPPSPPPRALPVLPVRSGEVQHAAADTNQPAASSTVPPATPVDLLAWIDPARDAVRGTWRKENGALLSPPDAADARLQIPCTVPAEYRLRAVVERIGEPARRRKQWSRSKSFYLGLVGGGRQFLAAFETQSDNQIHCGLELLDGKRIPENATTYVGGVFHADRPTTLLATVTKSGVRITADGREIVDYRDSFDRLSLAEIWRAPDPAKLLIASWKGPYRITALELTPLSGQPPQLAAAPAAAAPAPENNAQPDGQQPAADKETVKLADGTVLHLEKWGDTYEAHQYRPPLNGDDWRPNDGRDRSKGFHKGDPRIETVYDAFKPLQPQEPNHKAGRLRIDPDHHMLYWADNQYSHGGHLHRFDLRTHRLQMLLRAPELGNLALDLKYGKMYWFERDDLGRPETILRRANLDGTQAETVLVGVPGGALAGGLAVDSEKEFLYFGTGGEAPGIFRMKLSELSAKDAFDPRHHLIVNTIKQPHFGTDVHPYPGSIVLDLKRGMLYWCDRNTSTPIYEIGLDGKEFRRLVSGGKPSPIAFSATCPTSLTGRDVAVDSGAQKLYCARKYGLYRTDLDGSHFENLVSLLPEVGGIALDLKAGYLYWTETRACVDLNAYSRIRRIKIPPPLPTTTVPAPPVVDSTEPGSGSAGDTITLQGRFFADASKVAFIDTREGRELPAQFHVTSDRELSVVVPDLSDDCAEAAIVVLTPSGVTVTLPKDIPVLYGGMLDIGGGCTLDYLIHKHFLSDKGRPAYWLRGEMNFGGIDHSIVYCTPGTLATSSTIGRNVFFVKNGAAGDVNKPRCLIYHEPYAVIQGPSVMMREPPEETRTVPVPAIRPSFVERLFQVKPPAKP